MEEKSEIKPINVRIQNFQSIKDIEFEIRGFTCISGKSNLGKSAIIRAISSSFLNSPVNDKIRKGSKFCSVTLQSKDWGFKWEKGSGTNRYFIPPESDKPLSNFGAGQIEPISSMGFKSVRLGRQESNPWYADQFHPLFLLDETGASVTDFISEVSKLQVLQDAIIISSRFKKKNQDEHKVRLNDLQLLNEKISKVSGIASIEVISLELEEQANSITQYEDRISRSDEFMQRINSGNSKILSLENISKIKFDSGDWISSSIDKLVKMKKSNDSLHQSAQKIIGFKPISNVKIPDSVDREFVDLKKMHKFSGIEKNRELLDKVVHVDSIKIPEEEDLDLNIVQLKKRVALDTKIKFVKKLVETLDFNISISDDLESPERLSCMNRIYQKLQQGKAEILDTNLKLSSVEKELEGVEKELAKIPNCPTCGRVTKGDYGLC